MSERAAHLRHLLEQRPIGEPVALFIDALLEELPNLIEDRVAIQDDPRDALEVRVMIGRKRSEFSHVVANVEHLRHVIRQYYRNISI